MHKQNLYYLTFQATNSMEESHSWEDYSSFPSQEILRILKNETVNYSAHNSSSFVPNLGQINPVQPPTHFLKIHFSIILTNISVTVYLQQLLYLSYTMYWINSYFSLQPEPIIHWYFTALVLSRLDDSDSGTGKKVNKSRQGLI